MERRVAERKIQIEKGQERERKGNMRRERKKENRREREIRLKDRNNGKPRER